VTEARETTSPSAREAAELPAGAMVGEYRVERLLGRGGMGEVYGAVQPEIGARVAIKVLAGELSRDPRLVKRFVDEARAVNKIGHANIIDIFAFGRLPDGRQYFVMEYLEGETLGARLARGPLPVTEARRLLLQICEALEAAHREQIIHRDLKPDNLWIATPRHGQPYAKILDFGIAKLHEPRDVSSTSPGTEAGVAMGTPFYMSPEQCRGDAVDHRTDIYAMGALLYLMWSGRLPFEGGTFLAVVTQQITATPPRPSLHRPLPDALERLILACLEKDPARRPQSAQALGAALDAALAAVLPGETLPAVGAARGGAAATRETGPPAPSVVTAPARGRGWRLGVALALVLAAVVVVGLAAGSRATSPPTVASPAPVAAPPAPAPAPAPVMPSVPAAGELPTAKTPREREKRKTAPASAPDDRGYLKENPFR
jgi:eukaryotic-like serine/threonine-protein kinase